MSQLTYESAYNRKMMAEVKCGNCIYMSEDKRCHKRLGATNELKSFFVEVRQYTDYCGDFHSVKKYDLEY